MNNKVLVVFLFLFMLCGLTSAEQIQPKAVSAPGGKIKLLIDPTIAGERIEIYRSLSDGNQGEKIELNTLVNGELIDQSSELENGLIYFYTIRVYDRNNKQINTYKLSALVDTTPPVAPVLKPEPLLTHGDFNWVGWLPSVSTDVRYYWTLWAEVNDTSTFIGIHSDTSLKKDVTRDRVDNLVTGHTYFFFIKAVDYAGNESPWNGPVSSTQQDKPQSLLQAHSRPLGTILLNWDTPAFRNWFTTNSLSKYKLYRSTDPNFVISSSTCINDAIPLTQTNFTDSRNGGLLNGRTYYYRLVGIDQAMVEIFDEELTATLTASAVCDDQIPCIPVLNRAEFIQYDPAKRLVVFWRDTCFTRADSFKLFLTMDPDTSIPFIDSVGFKPAMQVFNGIEYVDTLLRPGYCGTYYITIKARDLAGNVTSYAPFLRVNVDQTAPFAVRNLVASSQTNGSIRVGWEEARDDCDDEGLTYKIHRSLVPGVEGDSIVQGQFLNYLDGDFRLTLGGYNYTIKSLDKNGNVGLATSSVIGYCNKPPQIVAGNGCFQQSFTTLEIENLTDRLMGAQAFYFFDVYRNSSLTDRFVESGWQAGRTYLVTPIVSSNQRMFARVKVRLEKDGQVLFETAFSQLYWLERNAALPNGVRDFKAVSQRDGSILLTWQPPALESESECSAIRSYTIFQYDLQDMTKLVREIPNLTQLSYVLPADRIECHKMMYFKIVATDNVGNTGAMNQAPWASVFAAPAPDWTSKTNRLGRVVDLVNDTVFFEQRHCRDMLTSYGYQFGFDPDFDSLYYNYISGTQTVTEFITTDSFIILPASIKLSCDSLYIRVRSYLAPGLVSDYCLPFTVRVDQTLPTPPANTGRFYINGRANIFWSPSSDTCSAISHYRIMAKDYNDVTIMGEFIYPDTLVSADSLFAHLIFLNDTLNRQFNIHVFAIDLAGNQNEAEKIIKIESRPEPPNPPQTIYHYPDRYFISSDSMHYAMGDTHTVFFTYKMDFSDISLYRFYLEASLDPLFQQPVFDESGWVIPEMLEPKSSDTTYYFYYKFGVKIGHPKLRKNSNACQPFYFRVKVIRDIYNDISDWSNTIAVTPDYTKPFFETKEGTGPLLYYVKRPQGVQYLNWSQYPVSEECSGFKAFKLEGCLKSDFQNSDTVLTFPPDSTSTVISLTGKGNGQTEFEYWYRIYLIDSVGNTYVTNGIKTMVNDANALMNIYAWDPTTTYDLEKYTHDPLIKIEIFSPDSIHFIKYYKSLVPDGTSGSMSPYKAVEPATVHLVDSMNLILNEGSDDFTEDGMRYVTAFLQDKKGTGIDTVEDSIILDRKPPYVIPDDSIRIKLTSSGQSARNDQILLIWSGIRDSSGVNSLIHHYEVYRKIGDSTGIYTPGVKPYHVFSITDDMKTNANYFQSDITYAYPYLGRFQFSDKDVTRNQRYYYLICPVDKAKNIQTGSRVISIITDFDPPRPPVIKAMPLFIKSADYKVEISNLELDAKKIRFWISSDSNFTKNIHKSAWIDVSGTTVLYPTSTAQKTALKKFLTTDLAYYAAVELKDSENNASDLYKTLTETSTQRPYAIIDDVTPLPVLDAQAYKAGKIVTLSWRLVTDGGNNSSGIAGYMIYRAIKETILSTDTLRFVALAKLTENPRGFYSSNDTLSDTTKTYYYKIAAVDNVGWIGFDQSIVIKAENAGYLARENGRLPDHFALLANFPNPFNPTTTITFDLPSGFSGNVELTVYNLIGQQVRNVVDQEMAAGRYRIVWDGKDANQRAVPTGVYFYSLQAGNTYRDCKKMLLIK